MRVGLLQNLCITDLHLFWCVILWFPVRYSTHPHFTIPKLLTECPILRLWVSTSVGVVESNIKKKRPLLVVVYFVLFAFVLSFLLFMGLEKLADQEFDAGDVPPHLEDRAVLLCVSKIKRVHGSWTDMLLPDNTWEWWGRERWGGGDD